MTEAEWLTCTDPAKLLDRIKTIGPVRARKLRLFAICCARRVEHLLAEGDEVGRRALAAAEEMAEGRAEPSTVVGLQEHVRAQAATAEGARHNAPGLPHYELLKSQEFVPIIQPRRGRAVPVQHGSLMDVFKIPGIITTCLPAAPEAVIRLRAELGLELPDEYVALLTQADGVYADSLTLYSSEQVPERNQTYEVTLYAPGFLTIGDDGGGRAIVLQAGRGTSPVFVVGHGAMTPDHMVRVGDSLSDWVRFGCPLDVDSP